MTRARLAEAIRTTREGLKRDAQVLIRLTEAERDRLRAVAEQHGLAPAVLARVLVLEGLEELSGGSE